MINTLLQAIAQTPGDQLGWMALADALEEQGDPLRAELVRHSRLPGGNQQRVAELLLNGISPCVPTFTNSIGMKFILIPPGEFTMGSPHGERGRQDNEGYQERVRIETPFWLGKYPVTRREYAAVTGKGLNFSNDDTCPVDMVDWRDAAAAFCDSLSPLLFRSGDGLTYRLPSEVRWEYACRAGTTTRYYFGDELDNHSIWYYENSCGRSRPVGRGVPNAWGLYDMLGNIREWCSDSFYHPKIGVGFDSHRKTVRGGCWLDRAHEVRCASRWSASEYSRTNLIGFRVMASGNPRDILSVHGE